jgi:AraC family transcriptional regulator, transcriptional activator of the genes for pyochelin and ferripyochelin receptors
VASIISQAEYEEMLEEGKTVQHPDSFKFSDIIYQLPQQYGKGYERWIQLHGIELLIIQQDLHNDLCIEYDAYEQDINYIEFGFNLSGNSLICGGNTNFLDWMCAGKKNQAKALHFSAGQCIRKVDIHLDASELIKKFYPGNNYQMPSHLTDLTQGKTQQSYREINKIIPEMKLPIEQIINCPFQGMTRNIYLEGKCLELIALKLEQVSQTTQLSRQKNIFKSEDIERIHYAKEILIKNINNPPSLLELARLIGLNDYKLKVGFRQCFGTTVFGYLYQQRMEKARLLLLAGQMSVREVSRAVGYDNQSYFTVAFRKRFGVNPKSYKYHDE